MGDALHPKRVMIVDDSADFRLIFRLLLDGDDRLEITAEAADGQEAVDLCGRIQPDVVVLDLAMPTMDGRVALPLIRERCPDADVWVYSAVADRYEREDLMHKGASGVLTKGDDLHHIFDVLAGEPA
jgi:DNA-binding NarL/FixJ family response regulator